MRAHSSLVIPLLFAAIALFAPALRADCLYMGGPCAFAPYSDSTRLTLGPGDIRLAPVSPAPGSEIRLAALMRLSSRGSAGFAMATPSDTLAITLRELPAADHIYDHDRLLLTLPTGDAPLALDATPDTYRLGKEAAITLTLAPASRSRTLATLAGGRMRQCELWTDTLPVDFMEIRSIGFAADPAAPLDVLRASLMRPDSAPADTGLSPERMETLLSEATDPYSGYWTLLDYTLEDTMLRPGGDYLLAILPAPDGAYDILYLDGATITPSLWTPGRRKGRLRPTRLPGLYRASWTDAEGLDLDDTATLQFTGTDIALLSLPRLRSQLRLHRLRP